MQEQLSFKSQQVGQLYLVPTPIGNLEDMTFRAVNILKEADLILAEDTRHSQKLLNHFEIATPQLSYHEHNEKERQAEVLAKLAEGQRIAQISDAGMPAISDPGADLVTACIAANVPVIPLPGASAGLTALIASGLNPDRFAFIGFLPRKKNDRLQSLQDHVNVPYTMIFYESPFRLKQTLADMMGVFGADRSAVVVRELTKSYENFVRGTLGELVDYYGVHPDVKGEICLLLAGNDHPQSNDDLLQSALADLSLAEQVDWWMTNDSLTSKQAIKKVAKQNGLAKQEVYAAYHMGEEA